MAKKQGTSYSPNTALIQGAGVAYKNYDNVPGMYAGLDKGIKAGMGMVDEAVKGYEAEQEKIKKEEEEAKAKKEAIESSWNAAADKVLLSSGALGDTLYNSTVDDVKKLKELYLQGVNEKDDKKRLEALRGLQGHSTWIQDHKQMNQDYAKYLKEGKLSDYFLNNPEGQEEAHVMDQIMGQKYKKTSNDEETGDVIFHVTDLAGNAKEVTSKQYNDMIIPKNFSITANKEKLQVNVNRSETLDEDVVRQSIKNSLPKNERDFIAAMHDDVSGKNMAEMLRTSDSLDDEILSTTNPEQWNMSKANGGDGDPLTLNQTERENFIKAATNPSYKEGKFWNFENSKQILEDQIFNGVQNSHTKHWEKKNAIKNKNFVAGRDTLPVNYGTGYITTKSANTLLDDIKNKAKNIFPPNGGSYRFNEKTNTYEKLTRDEETKKVIATPVSNQSILAGAGIWQQGYRVEEYGTASTEETESEENYSPYKIVEGGNWYGAVGDQTFGSIKPAIEYFEKLLREQDPSLKEDEIQKRVKAEKLKMEAATK